MRILLTGATGFVGKRLADLIVRRGVFTLTCAVRHAASTKRGTELVFNGLDADTDWSEAVVNQQVVIHAAARAHIMKDEVADPLAEYRRVNVDGTINLALQAAEAGVRRFIFLSSIKVNGEGTSVGAPYTAQDMLAPADPYGISKMEAEQGLLRVARDTGMELVIIRPPLVYGPGVKGNFARMIKMVEKGLPLPLGAIHNQRSLVALDNLVHFIMTCIEHPAAANQVFLVGDGKDLSTTELLRGIGKAMGKSARLIPVPAGVLMVAARMLGKKAVAQRLLGSLQVDISKARTLLDWEPALSVEEGLRRCFV